MVKFLFQKGHPNYNLYHTEETKRKIKEHNVRYWLGTERSGMSGHHHSEKSKEKISKSEKGKFVPLEIRWKYALNAEKKVASLEERRWKSERWKGQSNPNWKGGLTPVNRLIRGSLQYRLWREAVFRRDNYTCQLCGRKGVYLEADHIQPFALYPELRFDVNNGRTLCTKCHRKHGWRGELS